MKKLKFLHWSPAFSITAVNLIARAMHLIVFIAIGNRFGSDTHTDNVFLIQAPLLILMSVATGSAETVIMPSMHRAFITKSASNLLVSLVRRAVTVVIPITVFLLIVSAFITHGASPFIYIILAPMPLLATCSSIYMGVLNAEKNHLKAVTGPLFGVALSMPLAFLLPITPLNLAFIFLSFEFGRFSGLWLLSKKKILQYRTEHHASAENIIPWALSGAKFQAVGSLIFALNPFVDFLFAKPLGVGAITQVEYASRLWNLVPVLFNGPLILFYSKVSRLASNNIIDRKQIHYQAVKLFCHALLLSVVSILMCKPVIHLLYGFGRMDEISRIALSELLSCYLAGAGPFIGGLVYVRALSAEGRFKIISIIAVSGVLFNCIFNAVFIHFYGLNGIGLSTAGTYLVMMIFLVWRTGKT